MELKSMVNGNGTSNNEGKWNECVKSALGFSDAELTNGFSKSF